MNATNMNRREPQGLDQVVELLEAEQAILDRAKTVSQSILERVRRVTAEARIDPSDKGDSHSIQRW